jgi:hypothetical protein
MGGACSLHGRDEKCIQSFLSKNLKGKTHLYDLSIDGRIMLEWSLGEYNGKVWAGDMAQDRDQWWAVVNVVINLQIK